MEQVDEDLPILFLEGKGWDLDFAVLVHCNHGIISDETFGFFAAYFAGGLVCARKSARTSTYEFLWSEFDIRYRSLTI